MANIGSDNPLSSLGTLIDETVGQNFEKYFENMDTKHLMEQTQGALNEYAEIIRTEVFEKDNFKLFAEEVLDYPLEDHHVRIAESQQLVKPGGKQLTLAFRGAGKSTIGTVARAIYEVVRNPDVRILLSSNTQIQSEIFLREIKEHFEANQKLISIFGDFVGKKWDAKEIIVGPRRKTWKESSITCIGVGGPTASRHYDVILGDDLVDEENSRTELQREKLLVWFYKALIPTLEPDGRVFLSGTCWNPTDLYAYLRKNDTEMLVCSIPAIKEDGTSTWEEKFSIEFLIAKRQEMGVPIFETQYQMNTAAMEGKIFSWDSFHFYETLPENIVKFQGVDLAIGKKAENDYYAHATIGVDPRTNKKYVIKVWRKRLGFKQQTDSIVKEFFKEDPLKVGVEANAYQAAQVYEVQEHIGKRRAIPIFTLKDKVTRGMKLAAKCENEELLFKRDQMDVIEEMMAMPNGDHDDRFDAIDIAVTTSTQGIRKKRDNEPGVM